MKITICDDSIEDLMTTEKLLMSYKQIHSHINFEIDKYTDSNKLYQIIKEKKISDIYYLDMLMPDKTGIDLAKLIREKNAESIIIFTTSSKDYAMEAFDVHASRYLVKPFNEKLLFESLENALSSVNLKKEPIYLVKTQEGLISIPYSKIEYIENVSRSLDIHLTDGGTVKSIIIRKSFENEVEELIQNTDFIQVHKSFVVNMAYVDKLTQENMIMENRERIPISKKKMSEVKRQYLLYVTERYR